MLQSWKRRGRRTPVRPVYRLQHRKLHKYLQPIDPTRKSWGEACSTTCNVTSPDQCSNPVPDSCSFYIECLEDRNYPCGSTGYPEAYGYYYCTTFEAEKPNLSPAGQQWVTNTMLCLQRTLVPEALGESGAVVGCQALWDYAFSTHATCYVESGICLIPQDWLAIVNTIGIENLYENWQALLQALETAADCAELYAFIVASVCLLLDIC